MKILVDRGDENQVIEEEKAEWVKKVLLALGIHEGVLSEEYDSFDAKTYVEGLDLEIWNDVNGVVSIYRKDKLIAQWNPPELKLIKESYGKWYYEIKLNEWAIPLQMKK